MLSDPTSVTFTALDSFSETHPKYIRATVVPQGQIHVPCVCINLKTQNTHNHAE